MTLCHLRKSASSCTASWVAARITPNGRQVLTASPASCLVLTAPRSRNRIVSPHAAHHHPQAHPARPLRYVRRVLPRRRDPRCWSGQRQDRHRRRPAEGYGLARSPASSCLAAARPARPGSRPLHLCVPLHLSRTQLDALHTVSIESTGAYPPDQLLPRAIDEMLAKVRAVRLALKPLYSQ